MISCIICLWFWILRILSPTLATSQRYRTYSTLLPQTHIHTHILFSRFCFFIIYGLTTISWLRYWINFSLHFQQFCIKSIPFIRVVATKTGECNLPYDLTNNQREKKVKIGSDRNVKFIRGFHHPLFISNNNSERLSIWRSIYCALIQ